VPIGPDDVTRLSQAGPPDGPDARIGAYRLVRELGQGGMGAVYLAMRDDDAFHKRVALKILKRGMDTESIVRRFRTERQILAGLDHPHISRLLDGGSTADGLPYLVMEYVEGVPLGEYAELRQLNTSERLQLFLLLCGAVQYAHQSLVIHRDIKPANVLVTQDGVPKLLDFGIAKLLNAELTGQSLTAVTAPGLQLMTPEYASPEQVRGDAVTTATDVYSLGILLYELLTGRRPYRLTSRAVPEIVRVVCESEPLRPSVAVTRPLEADDTEPPAAPSTTTETRARLHRHVDTHRLRRRLEGDLDNLVMKAISKEPGRRYASVDQFAETSAGISRACRCWRGTTRSAIAPASSCAVIAACRHRRGRVHGARRRHHRHRTAGARGARRTAPRRTTLQRRPRAGERVPLRRPRRGEGSADRDAGAPADGAEGHRCLDKLAADAGDRADLRQELAAGYVRVGDVQGRPLNPNLGDTAGALTSYRKAVALCASLGVTAASAVELRREASAAQLRLSEEFSRPPATAKAAMAAASAGLDLVRDTATDAAASPATRRDRRELLQPLRRHAGGHRLHLRSARVPPAGARADGGAQSGGAR
jgi:serine/threonine protein kinase